MILHLQLRMKVTKAKNDALAPSMYEHCHPLLVGMHMTMTKNYTDMKKLVTSRPWVAEKFIQIVEILWNRAHFVTNLGMLKQN